MTSLHKLFFEFCILLLNVWNRMYAPLNCIAEFKKTSKEGDGLRQIKLLNFVLGRHQKTKPKFSEYTKKIYNKILGIHPKINNKKSKYHNDKVESFCFIQGAGSRDGVRRTMSFHGANPTSASGATLAPPSVDSPSSSPSSRKRHKPLAVKKLAARDLENCAISGYMERRSFSGQWIRYVVVYGTGEVLWFRIND